jgi:hypothetical protein
MNGGIEQERTFPGERIYSVCYQKVRFRFLKGPKRVFLKRGRLYWESFSKSLGEKEREREMVEVNVDEIFDEGVEGADKITVDDVIDETR